MFLTVTANPALDRLIFIPRFEPTTTMRTQKVIDAVGGKGYDVSVSLRGLGQKTVAVGFMAGKIGQQLAQIIADYGIQLDLIWVEGETRTAHVIIETELHRHSHIITGGFTVSAAHLQALFERYSANLPTAKWVIASGSLPAGAPEDFYSIITRMAHKKGIPVLIDTSGNPMLQTIPAHPEIIKMNWQEFISTFETAGEARKEVLQKARQVIRMYDLTCLLITHGEKGLLAFTPEGEFQAVGPRLEAVNAAGAGDAVSACIAWRLSLGERWPEALRWACAVGASAVLTERTAECNWQIAQQLHSQVRLTSITSM